MPQLQVKFADANQEPTEDLHLTGLPSNIDEAYLNNIFENIGFTVRQSAILPDALGRGTCRALITVGSVGEAHAAIAALNGQTLTGPAQPQQPQVDVEGFIAQNCLDAKAAKSLRESPPPVQSSVISQGGFEPGFEGNPSAIIVKRVWKEWEAWEKVNGPYTGPIQTDTSITPWTGTMGDTGMGMMGAGDGMMGSGAGNSSRSNRQRYLGVKFAGEDGQPKESLYVTGLPSGTDQASLTELFNHSGFTVQRIKILPDTKGIGSTSAIVVVGSVDEANAVIMTFHGQTVTGSGQQAQMNPDVEYFIVQNSLDEKASKSLRESPLPVQTAVMGQGGFEPGFEGNPSAIVVNRVWKQWEAWERGELGPAPTSTMSVAGPGMMGTGNSMMGSGDGMTGRSGKQRELWVKFAGEDQQPKESLYLTGLPNGTDEASLNQLFTSSGFTVQRAKILPNNRGTGSTSAIVTVGSVDEASAVIATFHGQTVTGPAQQAAVDVENFIAENSLDAKASKSLRGSPPPVQMAVMGQGGFGADFEGNPSAIVVNRVWKQWEAWERGELGPAPTGTMGQSGTGMMGTGNGMMGSGGGTTGRSDRQHHMGVKFAGTNQEPSENLYVTGLPTGTDQASLNELFANSGFTVQRSKILPNNKGIGATSAIVSVGSVDEANAVIATFNGQIVAGPSQPPLPQGASFSSGIGVVSGGAPMTGSQRMHYLGVKFAGANQEPSESLYITGLPPSTDQVSLSELFAGAGYTVVRSRILPDSKGIGHTSAIIAVGSVEEATAAIATFNGQRVADDSSPQLQPDVGMMGAGMSSEEMSMQVEQFLAENIVDDCCANDLRSCPPEVAQIVLSKGGLAGTNNPSGALIGRIKKAREQLRSGGTGGSQFGMPASPFQGNGMMGAGNGAMMGNALVDLLKGGMQKGSGGMDGGGNPLLDLVGGLITTALGKGGGSPLLDLAESASKRPRFS